MVDEIAFPLIPKALIMIKTNPTVTIMISFTLKTKGIKLTKTPKMSAHITPSMMLRFLNVAIFPD